MDDIKRVSETLSPDNGTLATRQAELRDLMSQLAQTQAPINMSMNGHQHAGIRIVCEGPTLLPALDAHLARTAPFTSQELLPLCCGKSS